jgi:hypothetical protein
VSELTIKTNYRRYPTLDWCDLTEAERAKFDYLDREDLRISARFVRYKGQTYDIGEFTVPTKHSPLRGWAGYYKTHSSGVVFRYLPNDEVVMGSYYPAHHVPKVGPTRPAGDGQWPLGGAVCASPRASIINWRATS